MKENIDYIKYFVDNEKKQKRITFSIAIIFTILASVIVGLAIHSMKQKKEIESLNEKIQQNSQTLVIGSLQNSRAAKEVSTQNHELLSIVHDLEKEGQINTNIKSKIEYVKNQQKELEDAKRQFMIYIQYAPGSVVTAGTLADGLRTKAGNTYKIPKTQEISSFKFSRGVRYFNKTDAEEAYKIANWATESTGRYYDTTYTTLNASKGQIEIWISN